MRKFAGAILATLAVVACDSTTTPDLTVVSGNYVLRTINGTPLPYTANVLTPDSTFITADTLFLDVGGSFVDVTHFRSVQAGVPSFPAQALRGFWTVQGSGVEFDAVTGEIFNGTVSGSSITIGGAGNQAVYSKL